MQSLPLLLLWLHHPLTPTPSPYHAVSPPALAIAASPIDSDYFNGLQLNLTCFIHIASFSVSHVGVNWTKSGSALLSNSRVTVSETMRVNQSTYQTWIAFSSLDNKRGDEGNYTCSANITLSGLTSPIASATTEVVISGEWIHHGT